MSSNINYKNINNLHSFLKFFYYSTFVLAFIAIISSIAIVILPNVDFTFERGSHEWFYRLNLPIGIGSAAFSVEQSIPTSILHFVPIEMINVHAVIFFHLIINVVLLILLINVGLKKLLKLTQDVLMKESPFQSCYIRSLRKYSFIIILYSIFRNTVLCLLFSLFVTHPMMISITFDFLWSGIIIGVLGYIFSDITEYGLFLQEEYDATL